MLLTSLLLIAAPASATGTPAVEKTPAASSKIICRSETELGSRVPKRICRTEAEWDEIYRQTQEDLANSRNDRGIAPNAR